MLKIKELRNDKGITLDQLAALSGVSKRMISAYEAEENDITLSKLQNIAKALSVTVAELIGETVIDLTNITSPQDRLLAIIESQQRVIESLSKK